MTVDTVKAAAAAKRGNARAGFEHKIAHLKMCVISKILHPMSYQSPSLAVADEDLRKIQRALKDSIFATAHTLGQAAHAHTAQMRDMGLGLVDIAATIDATVSRRVHDMLVDPENHPWKKLYRHQLWKHYRHKRPLT
jgi:hypothetical protein